MSYTVQFASNAVRALKKLPVDVQERLLPSIEALAQEPRPPGVKKLAAEEDVYRVRVGDYRIVYEIIDAVLTVLIIDLGDRKEIYRRYR